MTTDKPKEFFTLISKSKHNSIDTPLSHFGVPFTVTWRERTLAPYTFLEAYQYETLDSRELKEIFGIDPLAYLFKGYIDTSSVMMSRIYEEIPIWQHNRPRSISDLVGTDHLP